jgi:hypothetical protein
MSIKSTSTTTSTVVVVTPDKDAVHNDLPPPNQAVGSVILPRNNRNSSNGTLICSNVQETFWLITGYDLDRTTMAGINEQIWIGKLLVQLSWVRINRNTTSHQNNGNDPRAPAAKDLIRNVPGSPHRTTHRMFTPPPLFVRSDHQGYRFDRLHVPEQPPGPNWKGPKVPINEIDTRDTSFKIELPLVVVHKVLENVEKCNI